MGVSASASDGRVELTFDGELTIPHALALKDSILKAFEGEGPIRIRFGEVAAADLSFLQILRALHVSAEKAGRPIDIAEDLPPALAEALLDCGYRGVAPRAGEAGSLWSKVP